MSIGFGERNVELRREGVEELVRYFQEQSIEIHGARGIEGFPPPPLIRNEGFGQGHPHRPDIIGFDPEKRRIVIGVARPDRASLDAEESLEEYNVYLDHNAGLGERATLVLVWLPSVLTQDFISMITHYIHREYWHRIVPIGSPTSIL